MATATPGRTRLWRRPSPPPASGNSCCAHPADGATLGLLSNRFILIALTNAWLLVWEADFHADDAGLMVANSFGQEAMKQGTRSRVTVKRGESFRSCFGAAIHQGSVEKAAALYQAVLWAWD